VTDESLRALRAKLDERIAARDRAGAVQSVLEAIDAGRVALDDLYPRVLIPALIDTGAAWEAGTKAVWEEHFTSGIIRSIIESLSVTVARTAAAAPSLGRTILLACPSGEQHDLGLRMLSDRLALRGWNALYLGADTPADQIVAAARAVEADTVALSAATHYNLVLLRAFVDEVRAGLPGVRVVVGGPAFECAHCWPAEELISAAELGLDSPPPTEG
jgi:methanogenic corrinoid protein MtbC1